MLRLPRGHKPTHVASSKIIFPHRAFYHFRYFSSIARSESAFVWKVLEISFQLAITAVFGDEGVKV